MKKIIQLIIIVAFLVILVNSVFILDERQQAIITQFGNPVGGPYQEAGPHLKIPFIQRVHFMEKRILQWDGEQNQIPTADKKFIWVDTFARWRIEDPLLFYQTITTESFAHSRLDDIIDGITRDIITLNDLIEIVRYTDRDMQFSVDFDTSFYEELVTEIKVGRRAIADSVFSLAKPIVKDFGIELIDVQIKRVNYIEEVRKEVYSRMSSEREKIAALYRSRGEGRAAETLGRMERDLQEIESEAYRQAQEIRGRADAEATTIYAGAFNRDPEFYEFFKTLETYRETIKSNNTLILGTDSDYFRYLKNIK